MRKLVKVALVAGVAGGAAGAVQSFKKDDPGEVIAQKAVKAAGEAAAVGAAVAFLLDRRAKKKRAKATLKVGAGLTTAGLVEAAKAARPAIGHAIEAAATFAENAKNEARPRLEHAVEVARPKVESAARSAAEKAREAAEAAKPRVENAVDVARPKVEAAAREARERAVALAEAAQSRTNGIAARVA